MSDEKNNQNMNQQRDSIRNPYLLKENTTGMTENTYDPGYALKSSTKALDSTNNFKKTYISSSNRMEGECIDNKNDINKNENLENQNEISNSGNASYNNIINNEDYNESSEEPLYIMTLELEKGKSEKLRIYPNSDPYNTAIEFCQANNLDEDAVKYLASEIENLINNRKIKNENENNYENLDHTEEEFLEDYNGNVHYDYENNRNSSQYSNDSRNDAENAYNKYTNNENNIGYPMDRIKKNSKDNFYNNPDMVNQEIEENVALNNNMNKKNFLSENIPYLVNEQITEVDEENNITIEKLKSSKTEINDNSRSPIEKDAEVNDFNEYNSHLINKVIKDEEYSENILISSGKSLNEEYGENFNLLKNQKSENENINRSEENIIEKTNINNINCRSNYNYFKNNSNEINPNVSINERGRIMPNNNNYSDSHVYLKDNLQKDSNNLDYKKIINNKEICTNDKGKENYLNSNNEEKFFTFKYHDDPDKETKQSLNKNTCSNIESLINTNKNFDFKENIIINEILVTDGKYCSLFWSRETNKFK